MNLESFAVLPKWRAAMVAACAVMTLSATALPCECVLTKRARQYWPFAGSAVPPNVVSWVLIYYGHDEAPEDWQDDLRLQCVKGASSTLHELRITRRLGYRMASLELRPAAPLPTGATCSVVDRARNVVNWFEIEGAADRSAPNPPHIDGGRFRSGGPGQCGDEYATGGLSIAPDPSDPGFATQLFGAWLGVEGQRPNYAEPPLVLSAVDMLTLKSFNRYGHDPDSPINLDLSDDFSCTPGTFPYPHARQATLGLKALDLAGNWSAPSEVTLRGVPPNAHASFAFGSLSVRTADFGSGNDRRKLGLWLLIGAVLALALAFWGFEARDA